MNRRTFIYSLALPGALAMAVLVLWARSYRVMDEWSLASDLGEVRAVCIYQGGIHVIRGGDRAATRPLSYDAHDVPAGATWANLYPAGTLEWQRLGMYKLSGYRGTPVTISVPAAALVGAPTTAPAPALALPVAPFGVAGAAPNYRPTPWLPAWPFRARSVPLWWFVALALLPPARLGWRTWRSARRRARGLCPKCRYDLRATPDRCPECGWSPQRSGTPAP
ncbi:MAG TPA: hypothetical protein VH475_20245 [Tepidisphaeraceae bacterium]